MTFKELTDKIGELMFFYHHTHGLSIAAMRKAIIETFDEEWLKKQMGEK